MNPPIRLILLCAMSAMSMRVPGEEPNAVIVGKVRNMLINQVLTAIYTRSSSNLTIPIRFKLNGY